MPSLPMRPGLFLLAYWLLPLAGLIVYAPGGARQLVGSALLFSQILLHFVWLWQVLRAAVDLRDERGAKGRVAIATVLTTIVCLAIVAAAILRGVATPTPAAFASAPALNEVFGAIAAIAALAVFVMSARELAGAERRFSLQHTGGMWMAVLQFIYAGLAAGYVRRRLVRLKEAALTPPPAIEPPAHPAP